MNFTISCPSCQRTLRVPEDLLGQAVKCPSCGHAFTAPEQVEEDVPRPPASRSTSASDYEDVPRRRLDKPGKVQAIAGMVLAGGIFACVWNLVCILLSHFMCCLWPGLYFGLVMGIMAITRAAGLLGEKAYLVPPPRGIAIMMIINLINGDVVNLTLGILVLVFLGDEEVKDFFRRDPAPRE